MIYNFNGNPINLSDALRGSCTQIIENNGNYEFTLTGDNSLDITISTQGRIECFNHRVNLMDALDKYIASQ